MKGRGAPVSTVPKLRNDAVCARLYAHLCGALLDRIVVESITRVIQRSGQGQQEGQGRCCLKELGDPPELEGRPESGF